MYFYVHVGKQELISMSNWNFKGGNTFSSIKTSENQFLYKSYENTGRNLLNQHFHNFLKLTKGFQSSIACSCKKGGSQWEQLKCVIFLICLISIHPYSCNSAVALRTSSLKTMVDVKIRTPTVTMDWSLCLTDTKWSWWLHFKVLKLCRLILLTLFCFKIILAISVLLLSMKILE